MTRRRSLLLRAMLALTAAFGHLAAETGRGQTPAPARAASVARGEYLVRAGGCVACHTADPARPFAGGRAMQTRFGTFYTPNITSDRATGIGAWTDAQFVRAMREGIGRNGERLYPAFPFTSYTRLSDGDVLAMRAYLATVPPVRYTPPPHALRFPFGWRGLMIAWNAFNFSPGRFVPDAGKRAEWNRGAYLVEGLAHCGQCHTPRNVIGGLKESERLGGASVAGWTAGNLTPDRVTGIGAWRDDELLRYLASGAAPGRAYAVGPMAEVVANGTQFLTADDLRAMVTYLRSMPVVAAQNGARSRWSFGAAGRADVTALDAAGAFEGEKARGRRDPRAEMDSNRDGAGHGKPPDAATRSGQTTAGAANNARSAADSNRDSAVPGKTSDAGTSPNRETAGAARNAGTAIDFDRDSAGPRRTSDAATSLNHDTAGPAKNARTAADANSDSAGPARTPDASTNPTRETAGAAKAPQSATSTANTANPEGARLYAAACASCHGITGEGSGDHFPSLVHDALTAALGSMDTSNLVLVILHGVNRETRDAPAFMPAFGASLLDENIAALSNYLTRQFGDPRATTRAEDVARLRSIAQ